MLVDGLLDYLPIDQIREAFLKSPGNEIESGKFVSPESSASLAANTFGFFLNRPELLPNLPNMDAEWWPAVSVSIEAMVRFPWYPRGRHPWLDVLVETETHLVGIESKRYEPFRGKHVGNFSETYWRPVWGDNMAQFEAMRDGLAEQTLHFDRLDAAQLVKHAFGLRTEGVNKGKAVHLFYLYAEPSEWPDGRPVDEDAIVSHRDDIRRFSDAVNGAEVGFSSCTYKSLLKKMRDSEDTGVVAHANTIEAEFQP